MILLGIFSQLEQWVYLLFSTSMICTMKNALAEKSLV